MTEDKKFGDKLLNSIKENNIEPRPRWHFRLKEYLIWIAGAIFLIVGAVSVSLVIKMVRFAEFGRFNRMGSHPFEIMFMIVPIFWLALLVGFIAVVYYDFKMTKRGYKYSPAAIAAVVVLSSIVLGVIFSKAGLGNKVDDLISGNVPGNFYGEIINPQVHFWSQPGNGRLAGLIMSRLSETSYDLLDNEKKSWVLIIADSTRPEGQELILGRPIRALGKEISENEFEANEILPMEMGRGLFLKMKIAGPESVRPGMPGERDAFYFSNVIGEEGPGNNREINMLKPCLGDGALAGIFEAYPELKSAFINDLKENKNINEIIKNDPVFMLHLRALNIDNETINSLENE